MAEFTSRDMVAGWMQTNPAEATRVLESVCSQEEIDTIESAAAGNVDVRAMLDAARHVLARAGLSDMVSSIDAELAKPIVIEKEPIKNG
jgi:hypothetical protein